MNILKIVTVITIFLLLNHIVYAVSASRSILVYNINAANGIPNDNFDVLKDTLTRAGFSVDVKDRKEVPELDDRLLSDYTQLWLFETDADPGEAYAFSEREKKAILNFVNGTGGLLIAGEEDLSYAGVKRRSTSFERRVAGIVIEIVGVVVAIIFSETGIGIAVGALIFEAGRQVYTGARHYSGSGSANVFSGQDVSETLAEIQYGNVVSFTNTINPIAAQFGVAYEGLTDSHFCVSNIHKHQWSGAALAREAVPDVRGRYDGVYPPFCIEGSVNTVGGRLPGDKCACAQTEPKPVTEEILTPGFLKNVTLLYIDGREPLLIPFRNDVPYIPVALGLRNRTDTGTNHLIALAIPHVAYDKGAFGNIFFDASWTRYTNDYPYADVNHIDERDTAQYAIEVAEWVEPYPDIYEPSCEAIGDWLNEDANVSTALDNCCWNVKKGVISPSKRFLCAE